MPCLVGILAASTPRLALVLVVIFSDYIGRAYDTNLVPLLGFFFFPTTTLAYAWSINSRGAVEGLGLLAVVLGVLLDLGVLGGGEARRRSSGRSG